MTETKFMGGGGDSTLCIWQYMQYYNGKPVARFKVKEYLKPAPIPWFKARLWMGLAK